MISGERRNYEVSIWTLQDSFITVLKPANLEYKGQIQNPECAFKDDGTMTFSFNIPMYLYIDGIRKENPIWYTTRDGTIIADMRKLKLIFNKKTDEEKIFEFLIVKVTESHENEQLICKVESESLIFHELGHKGTTVSLSSQDFLDDYNEWCDSQLSSEIPAAASFNVQLRLYDSSSTYTSGADSTFLCVVDEDSSFLNLNDTSIDYTFSWEKNTGNGWTSIAGSEFYTLINANDKKNHYRYRCTVTKSFNNITNDEDNDNITAVTDIYTCFNSSSESIDTSTNDIAPIPVQPPSIVDSSANSQSQSGAYFSQDLPDITNLAPSGYVSLFVLVLSSDSSVDHYSWYSCKSNSNNFELISLSQPLTNTLSLKTYDQYKYYCRVYLSDGTVLQSNITTVQQCFKINHQPVNWQGAVGNDVTASFYFDVSAFNGCKINYQWETQVGVNWEPVNSAENSILQIRGITRNLNNKAYRCHCTIEDSSGNNLNIAFISNTVRLLVTSGGYLDVDTTAEYYSGNNSGEGGSSPTPAEQPPVQDPVIVNPISENSSIEITKDLNSNQTVTRSGGSASFSIDFNASTINSSDLSCELFENGSKSSNLTPSSQGSVGSGFYKYRLTKTYSYLTTNLTKTIQFKISYNGESVSSKIVTLTVDITSSGGSGGSSGGSETNDFEFSIKECDSIGDRVPRVGTEGYIKYLFSSPEPFNVRASVLWIDDNGNELVSEPDMGNAIDIQPSDHAYVNVPLDQRITLSGQLYVDVYIVVDATDKAHEQFQYTLANYKTEIKELTSQPINNLQYWCNKAFKYGALGDWEYEIDMDWSAYDGYTLVKYNPTTFDITNVSGSLPPIIVDIQENDTSYAIIDVGCLDAMIGLDHLENLHPVSYSELNKGERLAVNAARDLAQLRLNNIVYEDEYISSWDIGENKITPQAVESYKEKCRLVEISDSNFYNITQTLAEEFSVYCRYQFDYDNDYHIIKKKVIFYNNFIKEAEGPIDITYPYTMDKISRVMDGIDICTKLYVKALEDDAAPTGLITIATSKANPSREDYILNFDYLYDIGTITKEQYDEIGPYEAKMRNLNDQLINISERLSKAQVDLVENQATVTLMTESMTQDRKQMDDAQRQINAITNGNEIVSLTKGNAYAGILVQDYSDKTQTKWKMNISTPGVIVGSYDLSTYYIKIYNTLDDIPANDDPTDSTHSISLYNYNVIKDSNGNVIGISGFPPVQKNESYRRYLIFAYKPQLYYENIYTLFARKYITDENKKKNAGKLVENLTEEIENLEALQTALLDEQLKARREFSDLMGPALREGIWNPEKYNDYGDRHIANLYHGNLYDNGGLIRFKWDISAFDGEQLPTFKDGIEGTEYRYPLYVLTVNEWQGLVQENNFDNFSLICKEKNGTAKVSFIIGADMQWCKVIDKGAYQVRPSLVITNMTKWWDYFDKDSIYRDSSVSDIILPNDWDYYFGTEINNQIPIDTWSNASLMQQDYKIVTISNPNTQFKTTGTKKNNELYIMTYPRICVYDLSVKTSEDELKIWAYNKNISDGRLLEPYKDYTILYDRNACYFTIQPLTATLLYAELREKYQVSYAISTADTQIYLDAREVSLTNAYPKVSYDLSVTLLHKKLRDDIYNLMGYIANINDAELKFKNIRGYVSEINMKLDRPWEDNIKIKNYKVKFEDLFSKIVASSNIVQANVAIYDRTASLFNSNGTINQEVIQTTLNKYDLNYEFQKGTLTIDPEQGIWGTSEDGVVAFSGGGIFTATEKDSSGNWIWNTGILPSGINASLLNAGQIDTNLIRIFAGNDLKFQMNGDGLYAYRGYPDGRVNFNQYIRYNNDGIVLFAAKDEIVSTIEIGEDSSGNPIASISQEIMQEDTERLKIGWDGITIRNNNNERTFYIDEDGNAVFEGVLNARVGNIETLLTSNLIQLNAPTVYISALNGYEFRESYSYDTDPINGVASINPNVLKFKITPVLFKMNNANPIVYFYKPADGSGEDILIGQVDSSAINDLMNYPANDMICFNPNDLTFIVPYGIIKSGNSVQTIKVVCFSEDGHSYSEYLTVQLMRDGKRGLRGLNGYTAKIFSSNGERFTSTTDKTILYCNIYEGGNLIYGYNVDCVHIVNNNSDLSSAPTGSSYADKTFLLVSVNSSGVPSAGKMGQYDSSGQSPIEGSYFIDLTGLTFAWTKTTATGVTMTYSHSNGGLAYIGPNDLDTKATFTCTITES